MFSKDISYELFYDSIQTERCRFLIHYLSLCNFFRFSIDSIEEELPIILLEDHKLSSYVKGYLAYITIREYRLEPENELDKYAVAAIKNSVVVG